MEVNKSQKRLLIILLLVVAYAAYDFLMNKNDYESMYGSNKKSKSKVSSKKVQLKSQQKTIQLTDLDLKWKRDPFYRDDLIKKVIQRKRRIAPKLPSLKLQAITFSEENSFVMINDLILSEGEAVLGYVVEKIERSRVKLVKNGKATYLTSK